MIEVKLVGCKSISVDGVRYHRNESNMVDDATAALLLARRDTYGMAMFAKVEPGESSATGASDNVAVAGTKPKATRRGRPKKAKPDPETDPETDSSEGTDGGPEEGSPEQESSEGTEGDSDEESVSI